MSATEYKNAFIVTYGRSGSTLLQGMLNGIPGYLIRGENNDLAGRLINIHKSLTNRHHKNPTSPENAWYGSEFFASDFVVAQLRELMTSILLGDAAPDQVDVLGFKEVRYNIQNVENKIHFLRRLYPECAIIFNVRAPQDVVKSIKKNFGLSKDVGEIVSLNKKFNEIATNDKNAYLVRYGDVVSLNNNFRDLFAFLGREFDETVAKEILSKEHSYHRAKTRSRGEAQSETQSETQDEL